MNTTRRKVIVKSSMMQKISNFKEDSINQFCVDDKNGAIWFTYLQDESIYVYSFFLRKLVNTVKVYNPKLREMSNF